MRVARFIVFLAISFLVSLRLNSQQTPTTVQRDPQAVTLAQHSITAMAAIPPSDSTATGTVDIVEGSTSQAGTIQIQTLGTEQTSETLVLPEATRQVVYSGGAAKETKGSLSLSAPMQAVLTDQCPDFPLPLLLSALANPDEAFRYIGAETLDGAAAQHIQFWNSFASKPHLEHLAPFSLKDIWIDTNSGLPLKIAYSRRSKGGAAPATPVEITFSNYTKVGGILYPFEIKKSMNGTPWLTITVQTVSFNTGLSAAQFQVQ